jgi:hypothetical protein
LVDDKPIGVALNRNLGSPTAPGEAVEAELDRLIERRSLARKTPRSKASCGKRTWKLTRRSDDRWRGLSGTPSIATRPNATAPPYKRE